MMYAASYLMSAPGTQQLLRWGGTHARDLVAHTVGLAVDQQQLAGAAAAWHASGRELHQTADHLRTALPKGWESAAADSFEAAHAGRLSQLTALAEQHHAIGETLEGAAEQAGRVHEVLLASTHAAGEAVRLLAAGEGGAAHGPAATVAARWLETGQALLAAWSGHADHAAATLAALRPPSPRH
jgi:hypothetical protein